MGRRSRRLRSGQARRPVRFAGADGLSDTAYYATSVGTGLLGQSGGPFYGHAWIRVDAATAGTPRNIVSTRFGATTGVSVGYYVRCINNNTQITFELFQAAGSVVTSSAYTLLPADYGRALHIGWEHTGTEIWLRVRGVRVGIAVAAAGYPVPASSGMYLGRRANGLGESATGDVTVCGLAGGNFTVTDAEWLSAAAITGDVVGVPGKTAGLWSFKLDGGCNAQLLDRVGSAHANRTGAPVYTSF